MLPVTTRYHRFHSAQTESGSCLAVTQVVLSLGLRLHCDSNLSVKALGMLWGDLSYTVACCQRQLHRRSATYVPSKGSDRTIIPLGELSASSCHCPLEKDIFSDMFVWSKTSKI